MVVGIIGAMDEEIQYYLKVIDKTDEIHYANLVFYSGIFYEKKIVVVKSGAGKVNSALCTQILIDIFDVEKIIFTGVAGALNLKLNTLDIVISKDCINHDIDGSILGFEKGQILFSDMKIFNADKNLINLAKESAKKQKLNYIVGRILSGEQFINSNKKVKELKNEFNGDCVDMESAAVAQVAYLNNIPFIIVRTMSDKADSKSHISFNELVEKASEQSFKLVIEIISKM